MKCSKLAIFFAVLFVLWFYNCSDPLSISNDDILILDENGNLNIYVNPSGNNKNSGASQSKALKNIYKAIEITQNLESSKNVIHLAPGIYSTETNSERFPLRPQASTELLGAGIDKTIVKGQKTDDSIESSIFRIVSENILISKMTLLNSTFGIHLDSPARHDTLSFLELDNNTYGIYQIEGGITVAHHVTVRNSSSIALAVFKAHNCILDNNGIALSGRGFYSDYRNLIIANNEVGFDVPMGMFGSSNGSNACNLVIVNNGIGLKCGFVYDENIELSSIKNSIVWNNEQSVITYCSDSTMSGYGCGFKFTYCNIKELDQLETCKHQTIVDLGGNFYADPLFVDPASGDFSLQPNSPCIDAGDPAIELSDRNGSRNDLGAFGGPLGDW